MTTTDQLTEAEARLTELETEAIEKGGELTILSELHTWRQRADFLRDQAETEAEDAKRADADKYVAKLRSLDEQQVAQLAFIMPDIERHAAKLIQMLNEAAELRYAIRSVRTELRRDYDVQSTDAVPPKLFEYTRLPVQLREALAEPML